MTSHRKKYDAVFLTNVPAFYKVNLFNEIQKNKKILVIFVSDTSRIRNENFYSREFKFDHYFLNNGHFEQRSRIKTLLHLLLKLSSISYGKLIFSGWEVKEVTLAALISKRKKNAIVVESSIMESKTSGLAWFMKKIAVGRMSLAYPSGQLQKAILDKFNFKGKIVITHGVGISNFEKKQNIIKKNTNPKKKLRYVYIGRISPEKNVKYLVDVFKDLPYELILVGDGEIKNQLEEKKYKNIKFLGYVDNNKLSEVMNASDCFILPSLSEPWGLVVEEALISSIPVIVSNRVGCHSELVNDSNGIVFDVNQKGSLIEALEMMEKNYEHYAQGASEYNAQEMMLAQIEAYVGSI